MQKTTIPTSARALLALILPTIGAFIVAQLLVGQLPSNNTILLGAMGLISWFLGLAWYKLPGMGLRGKRALFAGIGFAVMVWLALLILRIVVPAGDVTQGGLGKVFFYLLVFEAFCVQLWAFGVLFRSVAEWRDPMTAVLVSGIGFGLVGVYLFGESVGGGFALMYFIMWGIFYGMVRLRTGSLLGMVLVQPLQTLTVWHLFPPALPPNGTRYAILYGVMSLIFALLIWRLLPKQKEDYRV
jgi:hypothetical protein